MQPKRQLIAAKGERKRQQDFDRIVINLTHHPIGAPTESKTQNSPAKGFAEKQEGGIAKAGTMGTRGRKGQAH